MYGTDHSQPPLCGNTVAHNNARLMRALRCELQVSTGREGLSQAIGLDNLPVALGTYRAVGSAYCDYNAQHTRVHICVPTCVRSLPVFGALHCTALHCAGAAEAVRRPCAADLTLPRAVGRADVPRLLLHRHPTHRSGTFTTASLCCAIQCPHARCCVRSYQAEIVSAFSCAVRNARRVPHRPPQRISAMTCRPTVLA